MSSVCRDNGNKSTRIPNERRSNKTSLFTELIEPHGEFDPGSGRTLAARLTHASRTGLALRGWFSGERVRNT